jgi:lysophospholipase L1-like esterase
MSCGNRIALLGLLVLGALSCACRSARPVTVHMIGDSTMADKPLEGNPERGWGQLFPLYVREGVTVTNYARNGRSTQSFIDEGRWEVVTKALRPGDWVFIQFGHNDEKHANPEEYARAGFKQNLERYVRETRAKGARPLLLTPVMRRRFDEKGRFFDTHGEYPAVVREVARELDVPLIDLHRETERMVVDAGVEDSKRIFLWIEAGQYVSCALGKQDDTHLSEQGARRVAGLVADSLRRSRLPLKKRLRAEPAGAAPEAKPTYLFAYFVGNGEDGLHFASSRDGLNWTEVAGGRSFLKPAVGRDKLMRDPFLLRAPDGLFHLLWTVSWKEKGIGHATSPDLSNWAEQQYIPVMEHEANAGNCWAPEMVYDEERGEYVIFWATTIPGRFPETDGQSRQGPPNPGLNHRMYAVTTKDFVTFSETRLFFDQGFNVIDVSIAKDGKRYVMFLKDETDKPFVQQKKLRVTTAESPTGPWKTVSPPITGDYWAEGPSPLKIGDSWIVYFDRYMQRAYGAVVSRNLERWEDVSAAVRFPKGVRHGTALRVSEDVLERLQTVN